MDKNVLIISSSPRKDGNSDVLCNEFMKGALETGNTVKKIRLSEKNISYCTGCGICSETYKCVIDDDMAELLELMLKADVIVLSTPVYFYSMNGQLKTFIDRTFPRYQEMSNKEFYFILTAADKDRYMMKKTLDALRGFTDDCLDNPIEKGFIAASGLWETGDVYKWEEYIAKAYEMGRNV